MSEIQHTQYLHDRVRSILSKLWQDGYRSAPGFSDPNSDMIGNVQKDIMTIIRACERQAIFVYIAPYLDYCREHNGLYICKNCGLEPIEIESDSIPS